MNLVLLGMNTFKIVPFANPSGKRVFRVYGRLLCGNVVRENLKTYLEAVGRRQELELEALNQQVTITLKKTRLFVPAWTLAPRFQTVLGPLLVQLCRPGLSFHAGPPGPARRHRQSRTNPF